MLYLVTQSCPSICDPVDCSQPGSSIHGNSPGKKTGVPCPPPVDLPNPGIKPKSSSLQVDSLPSEPPGKPKNTGVRSLSLPQGNFPTQESNSSLPHCMQILYQLCYQGSPLYMVPVSVSWFWYQTIVSYYVTFKGTWVKNACGIVLLFLQLPGKL